MKHKRLYLIAASFAAGCLSLPLLAQTDGSARMAVTIHDYNGSGAEHWTVAWVTTEVGAFIKSLRKQGTHYGWTSSQWTTHCPQWNAARGGPNGSQIVDGYTSATAYSYSGTNSPVILTWNGRDTNNVLMPDGNYKFWVQYAEDHSGGGPYTTNGLLWTKGAVRATNTYPNLAPNFTAMQVIWTPAAVAPAITSALPPASATVGVPYTHTCTATGTQPIGFTASGLPPGLTLTTAGHLSGIPLEAGSFNGLITATNGTPPDATQHFSISVGVVPFSLTAVVLETGAVVVRGTGPPQGVWTLLSAPDLGQPPPWSVRATDRFDAQGGFSFTNALPPGVPREFYRVRVP